MKKLILPFAIIAIFIAVFWYFESPLLDHFHFHQENVIPKRESDDVKNILKGITDFRKNLSEDYKDLFSKLKNHQDPDTLFICCSDSRIVPSLISSSNPGEAFVLRNVGNIIPAYTFSLEDNSAPAAIDYAVNVLNITDVVLCGHSDCGAMKAVREGLDNLSNTHLKAWLENAEDALITIDDENTEKTNAPEINEISKQNVLLQIEHLKTYPSIKSRIDDNKLSIHGLWFDVGNAEVYYYDPTSSEFVLIDENKAEELLQRLKQKAESLDS